MDLILWRHAEAIDLNDQGDSDLSIDVARDLNRELTPRGIKQAARMAVWLDRQLPEATKLLCSPALRAVQTVKALERKYKIRTELQPTATMIELLETAQWPESESPVLIIGHQPSLGAVVANLLGLREPSCVIKKGAVWWLRTRQRGELHQTVLVTIQTPEYL